MGTCWPGGGTFLRGKTRPSHKGFCLSLFLDIVSRADGPVEEEDDDKTEGKNHRGSMKCHRQNQTLAWLSMHKGTR